MAFLYLDSCVLIAAFELEADVGGTCNQLVRALEGRAKAVTSELTLAELLAPITRRGALPLERRRSMYMPLLEDEAFVRLVPVTRDILLDTAAIRGSYSQRLPDAIHVATACAEGCSHFVSSDRDARRAPPSLTPVNPVELDIDALLRALDA